MGNLSPKTLDIGIVVVTLLLTSYFLALGTNQVLAAILFPDPGTTAPPPSPTISLAAAGAEQFDATTILRRNIFDSETGSVEMRPQAAASADGSMAEVPIDPNAPPPRCAGEIRLVATMVSETTPELSVASIRTSSAAAGVKAYRQGMTVDGSEVVAIHPHWIVMRPSGGAACGLTMFGDADAPAVAAAVPLRESPAAAEPAGEAARGGVSSAEYDAGIRKLSDTKYIVGRSLLNRILSDRAELMRAARVLPFEEGGRVVGVKLFGIRSSSLLSHIGLNNGDMLRTINGFDMTSPDSALEAYARLRTADRLSVSIVRNGQPMTMDYTVQ